MLIPNHPHDERLSALASRDDDAIADASLTAHVVECARCASTVDELGSLRLFLSELPDVAPSRPLSLIPPVEDAAPTSVDGVAHWVRRLFAPVATAGAALALVGLVGTAAPALNGMAGGADSGVGSDLGQVMEAARSQGTALTDSTYGAAGAPAAASDADGSEDTEGRTAAGGAEATDQVTSESGDEGLVAQLPAERSPWPMVLFTGVALLIAALLLRWILVPRAG